MTCIRRRHASHPTNQYKSLLFLISSLPFPYPSLSIMRNYFSKSHIFRLAWHIFIVYLINHFIQAILIVRSMNKCEQSEFRLEQLLSSRELESSFDRLQEPFGVMLLNKHAVDMTLNWLCNTKNMIDVHKRMLFVTLDYKARKELLRRYPDLVVFIWEAKCLQNHFLPNDATYMSFFLFRTNLIRALVYKQKTFWMLQADTFWRSNLFSTPHKSSESNVLLDQTGHENSRQHQMNGANFLVFGNRPHTKELFDDLYWYQTRFYVTDPDAMKVVCSKKRYECSWAEHRLISGWEWIYTSQINPPMLIQMDGEMNGNKIETMKKYKLWFLKDDKTCSLEAVEHAKNLMETGQIPKLFSTSKIKQKFILWLGEFLSEIPIFGEYYKIYGGIPSLYLQIF